MKRYQLGDMFYINSRQGYGMIEGEVVRLCSIDKSFHYHHFNYIDPKSGEIKSQEVLKLSEYSVYEFIAKERLIHVSNNINRIQGILRGHKITL